MRRLAALLLAIAPIVAITTPDTAEACSYPEGIRLSATVPASDTVAVPTNTQIQVTYRTYGGLWPYTDELAVRAVGSTDLVPATITRDRYDGVQIVTVQPTSPLAATTTYEILDRVPSCEDNFGDCPATEPEVIATFTTGAGPDEVAPTTGAVAFATRFYAAEPRSSCGEGSEIFAKPIVENLADAGTAQHQLRIRVYDTAGNPLSGVFSPTYRDWYDDRQLPMELGGNCTGQLDDFAVALPGITNAEVPVIIRAVDLAGNEDTGAATVIVPGCPRFDANGDGLLDSGVPEEIGPGNESPEEGGFHEGGASDEGCSAAPGAGPLIGLALAALLRRRRRVTAAA